MKVGDRVHWTSQSHGVSKNKVGRIVRVVPAYANPCHHLEWYSDDVLKKHRASGVFGLPRDHESYLVKLDDNRAVLYWPRVSMLKRIEG